MGIKGLSRFFDNNPHLSIPFKLFDTQVIIDGNNLLHNLYRDNKLDCVYGGDYYKYATVVRRYFNLFLTCKVRPIVIFDGGHDKTNRKMKKKINKWKTRLNLVTRLSKRIANHVKCPSKIIPINLHQVFRNVLLEMDIPFAQCNFEADAEITAIANYYNCPVLSADSDFYVFDIRKGFIQQSSVKSVQEATIDGSKCKFIECHIYYIDNFLSYFPGIDRNMLSLFGTLIGNDYVERGSFERFFSSIQISKPMIRELNFDKKRKRVVELLIWLSNFSLDDAIDEVLSHVSDSERDGAKSMIVQSVESYNTQKCNLTTFVIEGDLKRLESALKEDGTLTTQCGQVLPIPFLLSFHEGKLTSCFLNIINHHRMILSPQVEDTSLESSYTCSRYIRQVIYGFLLQHKSCQNKNCRSCVEEWDRSGESPAFIRVMPIFTLKNGTQLPELCEVYSMDRKSLQLIISLVLDTEVSHILSVPQNLQLLLAGINYWLKNCSLKPREEFVYALLINLIFFNYILKRPLTGESKCSSDFDSGMHATISTTIDDIEEVDVVSAAQNVEKYLREPTCIWRDHPIILRTIHCFSELQTCIVYSVYLNMLLGRPFEQPKMHEAFSGPLVQNLAKELISCRCPDLFVAELLGPNSPLSDIFSLLKTHVLENVSFECYERIDGYRRNPESLGKN